jgi:GNAT superfamily N-acetyltransferase
MVVRRARADDLPALERIYVEAGRAAWAHILRTETLAQLEAPSALRDGLDGDALVLVVELDGRVVGFAEALAREPGVAAVRAFYTAPDAWGLGAGRALMSALLAELETQGYAAATLWTAEENHRPRRFYEEAGWRLDGTERHQSWKGSEFVELGYRIELTSPGPA